MKRNTKVRIAQGIPIAIVLVLLLMFVYINASKMLTTMDAQEVAAAMVIFTLLSIFVIGVLAYAASGTVDVLTNHLLPVRSALCACIIVSCIAWAWLRVLLMDDTTVSLLDAVPYPKPVDIRMWWWLGNDLAAYLFMCGGYFVAKMISRAR